MAEKNDGTPEYLDTETEEFKILYKAFQDFVRKSRFKNWLESLKHLQCGGKLCKDNCVLCTLLWICHHKLGLVPCGRQLEKLLTWYASPKVTDTRDLQCDQFMSIVTKCGIAEQSKEYDYNDPNSTRTEKINELWKDIMAFSVPDVRLLLLGRWPGNGEKIGHCVLCDLEKTTRDQKYILIYDPQAERGWLQEEAKFEKYLENDGGLTLYTVKIDVLHGILLEHWESLHLTSNTIPTLPDVDLLEHL